ncbi:MAG: (d)CMP kinase [Firmicutes bacterium]|jgi:cytidylate kinase|nr:(d)CMP kinase [Bacillota bacterium]HOB21595.1 (d)CMP kinase [Bacillota bacterium]HQD40381.1 (d)CMP kinase [Bacillota bacterium]
MQVAIDGPAGSGKSTVAKLVAERLGFLYIDTGAMYRALTLKAMREGLPLDDEDQIAELLERTRLELKSGPQTRVFLDGEDVSEAIRLPDVNRGVSAVAALGKVRQGLVMLQQEMAKGHVVMDGRDIGTVVLPQAEVKVFLTASLKERARRRALELQSRGIEVSQEEAEAQLALRDKLDESREIGPLKKADDAYLLDTTDLTIGQVVEEILSLCKKAMEA